MLYVCESVHSYPQTYIHRLSSVSNSCRLTQKQIEASEVTTEADFFTGNTICGRPYLERKNACYRHLQRLWPIHSHTQSNPSSQRVRVVAIQKSYYSHVLVSIPSSSKWAVICSRRSSEKLYSIYIPCANTVQCAASPHYTEISRRATVRFKAPSLTSSLLSSFLLNGWADS